MINRNLNRARQHAMKRPANTPISAILFRLISVLMMVFLNQAFFVGKIISGDGLVIAISMKSTIF